MKSRRRLIGVLIPLLLAGSTTPAGADAWSGSCVLDLQFQFNQLVLLSGTRAGYTIGVSAPTDADLDKGWSGTQACVTSLDPTDPIRRTVVTNTGSSGNTEFSCSLVHSWGGWNQSWFDRSGDANPGNIAGSHLLVGTWDDWTMRIEAPNFVGVVELRVHPDDIGRVGDCRGVGLAFLKMRGVMYFQDP
jgi:hypothetical protein